MIARPGSMWTSQLPSLCFTTSVMGAEDGLRDEEWWSSRSLVSAAPQARWGVDPEHLDRMWVRRVPVLQSSSADSFCGTRLHSGWKMCTVSWDESIFEVNIIALRDPRSRLGWLGIQLNMHEDNLSDRATKEACGVTYSHNVLLRESEVVGIFYFILFIFFALSPT